MRSIFVHGYAQINNAGTQSASLLKPRYWLLWLALGILRLLTWLPYRAQLWVGARLGDLAWPFLASRRRIAAINLALCFPDKSERERRRLLRENIRAMGIGILEMGMCRWLPARRLRPLMHVEGLEHLERARTRGRGVILLSAHFTTIELSARLINLLIPITGMYRRNRNALIDHLIRDGRERHMEGRAIERDNVRGFVKALRQGRVIWYGPDQSSLTRFSEPTPFFGHPAQTPRATGRFARMSGAAVVPYFALRRADGRGYDLRIGPALDDFPGDDAARDATRINALIEEAVRAAPEQYLWVHRRFKKVPGWAPYK